MLKTYGLSSCSLSPLNYDSCLHNKGHKLLFYESTFVTPKSLELIFSDVWSSLKIPSSQDVHYYVVIIDHFTCFTWLFPMRKKNLTLYIDQNGRYTLKKNLTL